MAALIQRRLSKAGLSKQSAQGVFASAATYGFGVDGGSIFKFETTENELNLTWSNRDILGFERVGVKPSQAAGTIASPNLIGLLLFGVLGADAVTGTGPYVHTMTSAPTLPYLTAFGKFGTADFFKCGDSKVSSLELSWEAAGAVKVKYEIPGVTPSFLASAYTETNNEILSSVSYFRAGGGTFNIESNPFAMAGGSIKINTHITQPLVAASVGPADVVEGKLEVTYSLKILPSDTGLFREVYFGSSAPGALSGITNVPRLGDISCTFIGPGTDTLVIDASQAKFMVEFPESSPEGGAAELTLAGTATLPTSGSSVTATLTNAVASY